MQDKPSVSDALLQRNAIKTRVAIEGCVYKGICCEEVMQVLSETTSYKVYIVMAYIVMA